MNVTSSIIITLAFLLLMIAGLHFTETTECYRWKSQASEFKDFYLTQWQSEQCLAHGITIQAPIR